MDGWHNQILLLQQYRIKCTYNNVVIFDGNSIQEIAFTLNMQYLCYIFGR